jgi:hypothetical protein
MHIAGMLRRELRIYYDHLADMEEVTQTVIP